MPWICGAVWCVIHEGFLERRADKAIRRENALMEELHEKEVVAARRAKLKLLLRRYSLAEHDFEGLALALAVEHEPGFKVNRQITEAPSGFVEVRIKDGKNIDKPHRRPVQWPVERLLQLFEAVEAEKKKSRLTKDLDALKRLARQKDWEPPALHRSNSPRGKFDAWVRTLRCPPEHLVRRPGATTPQLINEICADITEGYLCESGKIHPIKIPDLILSTSALSYTDLCTFLHGSTSALSPRFNGARLSANRSAGLALFRRVVRPIRGNLGRPRHTCCPFGNLTLAGHGW